MTEAIIKKIDTVLIANRGEIASRIIRTCRKMGIRTIAVYSDADRNAPYVQQADLAAHVGGSPASESYLDQSKIITVAKECQADAIHPGYGFLSENPSFAKKCHEENIIFIGPHPQAISSMGSKSNAKQLMCKHGVPVIPGYHGSDQSVELLMKEAGKIGFPLLLKATAGGGGKGMRIVRKASDLKKAVEQAKRESQSAFGNDELILEKYIDCSRHIEFQIFGDQHGNAIHLFERECTIQRRYQKVIEESPSPALDDDLRLRMGAAAVDAAKALSYDNAGTVEFIYDEKSKDFYFLEVNTRLQVEHPVTEEVTGLDLVQMQIECAQGLPLSINTDEVKSDGYAIEVRLYAEDAKNNFMPVTGIIKRWKVPQVEGLRVETAVECGSEISVFYDPMIAKLIVKDRDRNAAHRKMKYVLQNLVCLGTTTNQEFLLQIINDEDFRSGHYDTHYIDRKIEGWKSNSDLMDLKILIASTLYEWSKNEESRGLLGSLPSGWRNNYYESQKVLLKLGGETHMVRYRSKDGQFEIVIKDQTYLVAISDVSERAITIEIDGIIYKFNLAESGNVIYLQNEMFGNHKLEFLDRFPKKEKEIFEGGYISPMPSQIVRILAEPGQKVKKGDALLVISSMKMENTIEANENGIVDQIHVKEGDSVEANVVLMKLKIEN